MEKAIGIIEGMIAKVNGELDALKASYRRTRADNIYDARYRAMLVDIHEKTLRKLTVLEDVKRALEEAQA